ncbi:STP1 protein [Plasmodium ovale wallikeri]|uniref:STP1 protein n=1 Tax=Plasmodium ovale wallikeri TaxID=864142 RepID=A0A1A9AGU6_PLAOA|nr:STP1 protein [Plasmodium ovale wallikeri]
MQNYLCLNVSGIYSYYSVAKMVDNLGYTTDLRNIPVDVFFTMIKKDIKDLIHIYGHKNCGLRHEELCEKITRIIFSKKKVILPLMDESGRKKLISDWESQRNGFINKLFDEEGFINMCYPPKPKGDKKLQKLKSRHIEFCKEKDVRRAAVEAKHEYNACRGYNLWIETEKASFTHEYLNNVSIFKSKIVDKYFSTKDHPRGHDPRRTYNNSKLDCEIYNPASKTYIQKPVEQAPKNEPQLPKVPNIRQGSQEKDGRSVEDGDAASAKAKTHVKKKFQNEPRPDSPTSPLINTKVDSTANDQGVSLKPKAPDSSVSRDGGTKESTPKQGESPTNGPQTARDEVSPQAGNPLLPPDDARLTPATQSVSPPKPTISLSSSHSTVQDTTSSKTSVTSANTHSAKTLSEPSAAVPSLAQTQSSAADTPPAITASQEPGTSASSSASTFTTPVTTTTMSPAAETSLTMSTIQAPIPSTEQATSAPNSQEVPPPPVSIEPKTTVPITGSQQTVAQAPTGLSGSDTGGLLDPKQPVTDDSNTQTPLYSETNSKPKDSIQQPGVQSANSLTPHSTYTPSGSIAIQDFKHQKTVDQEDPKQNTSPVQIGTNMDGDKLTPYINRDLGKIPRVKLGKDLNKNPITPIEKNDNPSIIPEGITHLKHIIPTLLVILATVTLLFQLYKYTPFGFLLGRRRKRKKQDLRRTFEIPEKPTYESPNITVHEWEDPNLVGKAVENDVYTKLLKINRYKQEMQKRKNKNKKTLIEVHMEVLEEYKNDEWELHKGDFLEICLRGFINEQNNNYQNFSNSKLTINNINEKTIEDIQKHKILWNNWIEDHRNILEQWKNEEWFHILKNKWRNEEQMYKEKNDKLQENILNEQETYLIVNKKDIWKQWISKQATHIDTFNKEDWFKSMVYVQNEEKDNYRINEYNNVTVTSKIGLKNEKTNHEEDRSKNFIQKLMVQIHMMVLEESIKEDIIKHKELCIDNYIDDIHNQNKYDEKKKYTTM